MTKIYQVEFSDRVSRRYNEMPLNLLIKAKNKSEAKNKFKKYINNIHKDDPDMRKQIKIEGVFEVKERVNRVDIE